MRIKTQLHWLLFIIATACTAKSTASPTAPILSTPTLLVMPPTLTATVTETPVPTLTPTGIVITPPAFEEIKWAPYEFQVGASFEYPSDWFINSITRQEDFVEFVFPYSPYNLSARVFDLPVNDKAMTDPHSWGANEGGYELLWEKPISIQDASGLEFIWGVPSDNPVGGWLTAIYYSEKHGLMLRLDTFAHAIPTESNNYNIFEHIVQSVHIGP
jgi:hypothetical protein